MSMYEDTSFGVATMDHTGAFHEAKYALLLQDFNKWGPLTAQLDEWLEKNGAWREGVMVFYNDPEFYVLMKMAWS